MKGLLSALQSAIKKGSSESWHVLIGVEGLKRAVKVLLGWRCRSKVYYIIKVVSGAGKVRWAVAKAGTVSLRFESLLCS